MQLNGASDALAAGAFPAWLEGYKAAWETLDPKAAGALFTEDATYQETPHDAPLAGRAAIEAYWAKVTAGQKDVRFTAEVIACEGDTGTAHWRAEFTGVSNGESIVLDGIFVCRFADDKQVQSLKEWWNIKITPATPAAAPT